MRLVVAIEPRSYREAIGTFFREVRGSLDVSVVDPAELEAEIVRYEPDVVFSSLPSMPSAGRWPAWLEFHPDTYGQAVTLYLDGEYSEIEDADLGDLISIIDSAERALAQSPHADRG